MLENVEIGEQKRRTEAYSAAKKKAGTYADKLNDVPMEEDDTPVFGDDDDDDLRKSLERARKIALRKKEQGAESGPQSIALLASSTSINSTAENEKPTSGQSQENKAVFTEMEEFMLGVQLYEGIYDDDGLYDIYRIKDAIVTEVGVIPQLKCESTRESNFLVEILICVDHTLAFVNCHRFEQNKHDQSVTFKAFEQI